jgi:isopenicillin-N N-acyltransferase-like protein
MRTFMLTALLLASAQFAQAEIIAREGQGYLEKRKDGQLVLHVKGTSYEMGFQHGKLLAKAAKLNMERIVENKGELGKSDHYAVYLAMRPMMHSMLRPHVPARFKEELKGLAAGSGVPYAQVEAGNLFPAAFHCTGIALRGKATHDGSLYHVRILDYMTRIGLQNAALVIVHHPKGYKSWMNVGFAGFIGSVTGMNDAQVAIGEMGGGGLGYWNGVPMPFLIRDALERANTMKEAVEIFRSSKRTCEYYYVISDGKTRGATGIWATEKVFETMQPGESYGLMENMKPLRGAAGGKAFLRGVRVKQGKYRILFKAKKKVEGFIALPPKDTLVLSGYDRYQHFIDRLIPRFGKVDHKALIEMVKRPVSMKSNLHVAIFHPEKLEMWVAVASKDGKPACSQPYYRYQLAKPAPTSSSK